MRNLNSSCFDMFWNSPWHVWNKAHIAVKLQAIHCKMVSWHLLSVNTVDRTQILGCCGLRCWRAAQPLMTGISDSRMHPRGRKRESLEFDWVPSTETIEYNSKCCIPEFRHFGLLAFLFPSSMTGPCTWWKLIQVTTNFSSITIKSQRHSFDWLSHWVL